MRSVHDNQLVCGLQIDSIIGGSRGVLPAPRPPTGSISFVFAYIFAEKVYASEVGAPPMGRHPPNGKSWIRH